MDMKRLFVFSVLVGAAFMLGLAGCASTGKAAEESLPADFNLHALAVYTMDAIEGNILKDSSGKGHDAQISQENPKIAEGKVGKALVFDGAETYVVLDKAILEGKAWTFAAWVNADAWPRWARIFDFGDGATADMWFGFSGAEAVMRADIFAPQGSVIVLGPSIPSNEWVHLAITVDGQKMTMYVNGKQAAFGYTKLSPSVVVPNGLYIGASNWPDPLFVGKMDEILIADVAYTEAQIRAIMKGIPLH